MASGKMVVIRQFRIRAIKATLTENYNPVFIIGANFKYYPLR